MSNPWAFKLRGFYLIAAYLFLFIIVKFLNCLFPLIYTYMKTPTAIQLAEELHFIFRSAAEANETNPEQAVFTLDDVVCIFTKWGWPVPDFKGRAIQVTGIDTDAYKELLRKAGKAIDQAMKKKKVTQAELARITGKPSATINRWTSGVANLELSTIFIIEQHLGIKLINL
jgi:hypothetical protein